MRNNIIDPELQQMYQSDPHQFIQQPYGIIQSLINRYCTNNNHLSIVQSIQESYHKLLHHEMNYIPIYQPKNIALYNNNQLVRYRCMIQDVYESEIYHRLCVLSHTQNHKTLIKSGLYTNSIEIPVDYVVDERNDDIQHTERISYNCIPIPGESEWYKLVSKYNTNIENHVSITNNSSISANHKKRVLDNTSDMDGSYNGSTVIDSGDKRIQNISVADNTGDNESIPIELQQHNTIVTLYSDSSEWDQYKVCDIIDVIGIVSFDTEQYSMYNQSANNEDIMMNGVQHNTRPVQIHAISCMKSIDNQPLTAQQLQQQIESITNNTTNIRRQIIDYFSILFNGDSYTAEYLLLFIVSHVQSRQHDILIGKLSLNLCLPVDTPPPQTQLFLTQLQYILNQLVPCSITHEISINSLNRLLWQPIKDYDTERLKYGILQLSPHTVLLLDECNISTGELNSYGINNMNCINKCINEQTIDYNYQYNTLQFPCDTQCCIVSKGKSLLAYDIRLYIPPLNTTPPLPPITTDMMQQWRQYINVCRNMAFELTESTAQPVQQYLIHKRQSDQKITEDELHKYVNVTHLYCISQLQPTLNEQCWVQVKQLLDALDSTGTRLTK